MQRLASRHLAEILRATPEAVSGAVTLIETKLHPPPGRREIVARSHLLEVLNRLRHPLTLVDAPAGWGKTTLLTEWAASMGPGRVAWLTLDPGDNDPTGFWTYAVEALRRVEPGIGARALALLRLPGASLLEVVLPTLLNDLAAPPADLVLVLDDYHLVTNPEIHESVGFFVERLPAPVRVVLSCRFDPLLPLARLRARGHLAEVRARDLRFSEAETNELLNRNLGLGLDDADVARLQQRTEGWAAGLYLAALSLRDHSDRSSFVATFSGDHRHIVDYFGSEVLAGQPPEIRDFLLRTCVLDRLCGSLCDAVTGRTGSVRILEQLERSNLFLVPLDSRRQWYRYHHLFRELLLAEAKWGVAAVLPELHRRAAGWWHSRGFITEAVQHAVVAGDVVEAVELVASHWNDVTRQGRIETVSRWLDLLPLETRRTDARLCLAQAWTLFHLGRPDQVKCWTEMAEVASRGLAVGHEAASLELPCALLHGTTALMVGDLGQARLVAERAVALKPAKASSEWAMTIALLGAARYWTGEVEDARQAFEEAARVAEISGSTAVALGAFGSLALISAEQNRAEEAQRFLDEVEAVVSQEPVLVEHWLYMLSRLAVATLLERQGHWVEAEAEVETALRLARRGNSDLYRAIALLAAARVRHLLGKRESRDAFEEARELVERCPDPQVLSDVFLGVQRTLRLMPVRAAARPVSEELTERELAVLRLLSGSGSRRDIGRSLYLSVNTVKTHTRGLYRKLGVANRAEAVARARTLGLL